MKIADISQFAEDVLTGQLSAFESLCLTLAVLIVSIPLYLFFARLVVPLLYKVTIGGSRSSMPKKINLAMFIILIFGSICLWYYAYSGTAPAFFLSIFYFAVVFVLFELFLASAVDLFLVKRAQISISVLFKDVIRTVAYLIALMIILRSVYHVEVASLITTSAVLSIIVGLALQDTLGNFFSGFSMQIDRPFEVGDWILMDGTECKVLEMNWRSAKFLTRENDVLCIPNNNVSKSRIVNYTAPTIKHRCRKKMGTSYTANPNKVRNTLLKILKNTEDVLDEPEPKVFLIEYSDFSIIYEMWYWIEDFEKYYAIENEVMNAIWYEFKRNDIIIPFPIRTVHIERAKSDNEKIKELMKILRRVDFLSLLNDEELHLLASESKVKIYGADELIFHTNDTGEDFYIIKSGRVGVYHEHNENMEKLAELLPYEFFGEISLLTGEKRTATVKAEEDSELIVLNREPFVVLLANHPEIAHEFSRTIARRLSHREEKTRVFFKRLAEEQVSAEGERIVEEGVANKIFSGIASLFKFKL